MAFSMLGKAKTSAAPTTPVKTVDAEVVAPATPAPVKAKVAKPAPAPAPVAVVAAPAENRTLSLVEQAGRSVFADSGMGISALSVILQNDSRSLSFPVLLLSGGNSGGAFAPIKAVPEAIANEMPQGKRPFEAFILGHRTEMVSWPVGFDDKEDGQKPVWSVAIRSDDRNGLALVRNAAKTYQYTKNVEKGKFDAANSGVGHVRPALQLLVWLPEVQDLIVVQTPAHFESWRKTVEQLSRNAHPETGEVLKFPASLKPISTVKQVNGFTITEHVIEITPMLSEAGAKVMSDYAIWRSTALENPELIATVGNWIQCVDAPLTPEITDILRKAPTL